MDQRVERQAAFRRADALAREVLAAGKTWPAHERAVYHDIRRAALETPALVAGALAREGEAAARSALEHALDTACRAEYLLRVATSKLLPGNNTVARLSARASEAREAVQDHIAAMRLTSKDER